MLLSILLTGVQYILAIILLLVLGYAAFWVYFRRYNFWEGKPIKCDKPVPLVGNMLGSLTGEGFHYFDKKLCDKYGRLFGSYSLNIPALYVADPELLKLILVKDFNIFPSRRDFQSGNPLLDNMISVLKGDDKWRNLRNTMTPAFSTGKLKKMIPEIGKIAQITAENFRKHSEDGSPVNCKSLYGNYTLDVIANVAFGTTLDSHNDPNNIFIYHAKKVFSTDFNWKTVIGFFVPKLANYLGIPIFPKDTLDFFRDTVETIVKRREDNKEERPDFLQTMMKSMKENEIGDEIMDDESNQMIDGASKKRVDKVESIQRKPLTKDEFLSQTILFFLAAYDTTATALTSTSYFLALNPECQKKAAEEADRIWKNRTSLDGEALHEAKYIAAVVDETLRLCPPASRMERTSVKDYELADTGFVIQKGMLIEIPTYAIHHDPEFFPEPEKFKPERFLDEEKQHMNPYTYLPFGAGPRNCIAMRLALLEVQLCLLYILRDFTLSPSAKTKIPIEFHNGALLQIKDVILHYTKRN